MTQVRTRRVLYIPGYDPTPPRALRERYRREAARQADISGHGLTLTPGSGSEAYGWGVAAEVEGSAVRAEIEVLYWADIVRGSMDAGIGATYAQMLRTAWIYLSSGALGRLMRLRKGPVIAALYPVAVLLGQGALALMLAVAGLLASRTALLGALGLIGADRLTDATLIIDPMSALVGFGVAYAFLRWCARRDPLYAWYLIKDYAFAAEARGAYPAALQTRLSVFETRLAEALASDADEVLVVGHSSGAYLAVSLVAEALRAGADTSRLSLLTLGQVIPMVSFLPAAQRLRGDLARVAKAGVAWVDVSAPGDGCCFALCDPVAVSGVAPEDGGGPLVISAAFSDTLSEAARAALRGRLFETHFQYLNAFDALPERADAYDYFRVTAGPMRLSERFAPRGPSPSRITTPTSGYTDT